MEAKDLRIGNYIDVRCIDSILSGIDNFTPKPLSIHNLIDIYNGHNDFIFKPIPITEEWLLRFGFFKVNSTWFSDKSSKFRTNISFDIEWQNHWLGIRIKYVHQLQNLYHAHTGEELTLKQ